MKRRFFQGANVRLSYLDSETESQNIIVALHGHFGAASMFSPLVSVLPEWRVVALDQRGHGWSEHVEPDEYSRSNYIQDILLLIEKELGGQPVVLLGHSLGGVNAYQFAAKHPTLVKSLIIEDIGTVVNGNQNWANRFSQKFRSLGELQRAIEEQIGKGAFSYFQESVIEDEDGWSFRFHINGIIRSQEMLNGSWWADWEATSCPLLLMQGERSHVLSLDHAQELVNCRSNTQLVQFPGCSHSIHDDDLTGYLNAIKDFLNS